MKQSLLVLFLLIIGLVMVGPVCQRAQKEPEVAKMEEPEQEVARPAMEAGEEAENRTQEEAE